MYSFLLGLESLRQHARRNVLAGAAIAVGLLAMMSIIGYVNRTNSYLAAIAIYIQQPGHVAIIKKDSLRRRMIEPKLYSLSAPEWTALDAYLSQDTKVAFISPYLFGFGLVGDGCKSFPFTVTGFDLKKQAAVIAHPELKAIIPEYKSLTGGENLWDSHEKAPIALSGGLAKKMNKSANTDGLAYPGTFESTECDKPAVKAKLAFDRNIQLLTQDFDNRLNAVDGDFVGEFSTGVDFTEKSSMQMPIHLLQELLRTDKISYIGVFLKNRLEAHDYAQSIVKIMADKGIQIDAYPWDAEAWNQNYFASAGVMVVTELFVGLIVALVVLLSIVNTLTIGLAEARREIGMLRAVGYNPNQIASIFAVESFATAVLAVGIGSLLAFILFEFIAQLKIAMHFPGFSQESTFQIDPPSWTYAFVSVLLVLLVVGTSAVLARRYASQPILNLLDRGG
ncbi:MAG: FtsX-like permease family protein [Chitinophagaceae bacterium]|nr:FtsX-like permease family protein [Oligoflexus sp.]